MPGRRPRRSSGHPIHASVDVVLPGRLEHRPGEIRDGAHNPDGIAWLCTRLAGADYTVCASMLADKDVDEMLRRLASIGDRFVATASSNPRSLSASDARRAGPAALRRSWRRSPTRSPPCAVAHALGEPVLVTGSLYLLADLEAAATR